MENIEQMTDGELLAKCRSLLNNQLLSYRALVRSADHFREELTRRGLGEEIEAIWEEAYRGQSEANAARTMHKFNPHLGMP